ncbi:MAG: MFS transporter [Spirochaetia bacterium]|nr:MFS transporter [Spirochaetia bacterium]
MSTFARDKQYIKFSSYGFLKNLRFFDAYILLFFREMGISYTLIGVLFSIREILTNLMEIPSGLIADTFGRRRSMVFCFASYIVSFALFFLFSEYWVYVIAMVFFALGEAFRTGTHKAMILEHLRLNHLLHLKADYYGHTRGWSQAGSALSAFLAAIMVFYSGGYRIIFLFSIIPYILGLLLMISYPKELDFAVVDGKMPPAGPGAWKQQFVRSFSSLGLLIRSKEIRRGILNFSMFDGLFKAIKDYLQPVIEQLALILPFFLAFSGEERAALLIGLVYTLLFLLTSFASSRAGAVRRRVAETERGLNLLFLLGALMVMLTGYFYLSGWSYLAVVTFIIYYMIQNIRRPLALDYISDRIEGSVMATGLSGESQIKTLITAILAPLFGLAVDTSGLGMTLIIFGAMLVFFAVLLRLVAVQQAESA